MAEAFKSSCARSIADALKAQRDDGETEYLHLNVYKTQMLSNASTSYSFFTDIGIMIDVTEDVFHCLKQRKKEIT